MEMMGEGSGMEDMDMEPKMGEDKEMSGSGDDNDMMTLPQVMMSMGMEKQADKKCNACAMECMEEKEDGGKGEGYGYGEGEGEMSGYGDKPEGEWEKPENAMMDMKPEGEMSGSGMGMKGDKNIMKKKMCLKKCVQKEKIQMLANSFCDMMKSEMPEGEMGSGMMKPEGEDDKMRKRRSPQIGGMGGNGGMGGPGGWGDDDDENDMDDMDDMDDMYDMDGGYGNKDDMDMCMNQGKGDYG